MCTFEDRSNSAAPHTRNSISIIPIRMFEFSERLGVKRVQLGLCCAHAINLVKGQGLARGTVK
jgi:hypothetical protein